MKMQWIVALLGLALAGTTPVPAFAHNAAYFDSHPSPHGGQRRMAGPYHIELVSKPGEVTVYLTDHIDQEISTAGGEGKAVVRTGNAETTIKLTPAGNNILKGEGDFALKLDSTVTVFVKLPDQEAWGAQFSPLKPKANAEMKDDEHHDHDADHHDDDHDHDADDHDHDEHHDHDDDHDHGDYHDH
jgi:hypothetical protein